MLQSRLQTSVIRTIFASFPRSSSPRFFTSSCFEVDTLGSPDFRIFYTDKSGKKISPWHDISLKYGNEPEENIFTYVNEIPIGTRPKMEISTEEEMNPIKQDVKDGNLRLFTYGDIPFNYGCIPQTWEDPSLEDPRAGYPGDNDPIDVVEICPEPLGMGAVVPLKILGIMALIDEEETDWKVIGIRASHPMAKLLHTDNDIEKHMGGTIDQIREWFRMYKTTDGKDINTFAFDERVLGIEDTLEVISHCHESWCDLVTGKVDAGSLYIPEKENMDRLKSCLNVS